MLPSLDHCLSACLVLGTGLAASTPHESVFPRRGGSRQVLDASFQAWHSSWVQVAAPVGVPVSVPSFLSLLLGAVAGANA